MIAQHEKRLLQLLDGVLHDTPIPHITVDEWKPLYNEMKEQCVSILPSDYMDEFSLNPEQREAYWGSVGKAIQYYYTVLIEQSDVVNILQGAAIPVAVLKGVAAAMSYPHPEYRSMGDIDLIVPQEQFAEAYKILCSHGYSVEKDDTLQNYIRHMGFLSPNGIENELHHHFSSSTNAAQNKALDDVIENSMSDIVTTNISDFPCPVLPPLANGLVLLSHIDHHLGSGLGLRQIIDWMMYVEKYINDDFWMRTPL